VRSALVCCVCGSVLLVALALAGNLSAASPGWSAAGTLPAGDDPLFAGNGISVAPGGGGVIAWTEYQGEARYASFSGTQRLRRAAYDGRPLLAPFAQGDLLALGGGRAVVVGAKPSSTTLFSLAAQDLGPGAAVSRPQVLGRQDNREADAAVMAAAANGRLAVLGDTPDNAVLSVAAPHRRFGAPVVMSPGGTLTEGSGEAPATALAVAVDDAGDVLAAWVVNGELEARWRAADGRLGPVAQIAAVESQVWLAAALSANGTAALVWETQDDRNTARPGPATSATTVAAATAPLDGSFAAPTALDSFRATAARYGTANAAISSTPVVGVVFSGEDPVVAWTGHAGGVFTIRTADLDNPGSSEQTLSDPAQTAILGSLAATPGGGAILAWSSQAPMSARTEIETAQSAAGAAFGPAQTLPGDDYDFSFYSDPVVVAVDPRSDTAWLAALGASLSTLYLYREPAPWRAKSNQAEPAGGAL
jgi:hypothetical protein